MSHPVTIFCCAASRDTALLDEWETHLLPLQQAGRITFWSECHLAPGINRQEHILNHLEKAEIIVLLLSADFFASPACIDLMTRALQRFHSGQAHLVPLLLRAVAWGDTALREFSCLPRNARPITQWSNRDEAFQDCLENLKRLLTTPVSNQGQDAPPVQRAQSSSATYHSCFLSYAHQDEPLAHRLRTDLQAQGVHCWSASHDMKIGAKIRPTIDQAIQRQEKILILLSENALKSTWIEDEVEAALEYEKREQREMLFPVRLDDNVMQTSQAWAAKLRRTYNIGDFTNWTEPQAYQQAFERLLGDLKKTDDQPTNKQQSTRLFLPDLEAVDNLVMKSLCEMALADKKYWINVEQLMAQAEATGIGWDQFFEAMKVLGQQGFLEMEESIEGDIVFLKLTTHAFERYAQAYIPNYQELKIALTCQVLQDGGKRSNKDLASQFRQPIMLCNHILYHLVSQGFVKVDEMMDGSIRVRDISAELNRAFKNGVVENFLKKKGA